MKDVGMDVEELEKMWAEDAKIDETNLSKESARIPETSKRKTGSQIH